MHVRQNYLNRTQHSTYTYLVGTRGFVLSSHSVRSRKRGLLHLKIQSVLSNPANMHQWHVRQNYLNRTQHSTYTYLVGTRGFEPPTPSTPYWCASQTAPRPVFFYFKIIQMISKAINLINIFNLRFKLSFHKFIYRGQRT